MHELEHGDTHGESVNAERVLELDSNGDAGESAKNVDEVEDSRRGSRREAGRTQSR